MTFDKTAIVIYHQYGVDPTLISLEEKIIMSYVRSWRTKGTCFGSDQFFGQILGCNHFKVNVILDCLAARGKLIIKGGGEAGSRQLELGPNDLHPINNTKYFNTDNSDIFNI